jgi:hypothetical protein
LKSIARGDQKSVDKLVAELREYHEKVKSAYKIRDTSIDRKRIADHWIKEMIKTINSLNFDEAGVDAGPQSPHAVLVREVRRTYVEPLDPIDILPYVF